MISCSFITRIYRTDSVLPIVVFLTFVFHIIHLSTIVLSLSLSLLVLRENLNGPALIASAAVFTSEEPTTDRDRQLYAALLPPGSERVEASCQPPWIPQVS